MDRGRRLAGARVQSEGIDYSGRSTVQTNGSGVFVVPMKRNGRATIAAEAGAMVSNTVSAGPSAVNIDGSSNCLVLTASADSLTIRLTWGERPSDVDSHVYFANGSHVYYVNQGSLTSDPYAALDVDDTSSFGPEVITLRRMMVGTHRYTVHNYSGTSNPGLTASPVRVELNWNGTTRVFTPPAGETASTDWWAVFDFTVAANCSVTMTPLGTWSSGSPAPGSSGGTTYCSP